MDLHAQGRVPNATMLASTFDNIAIQHTQCFQCLFIQLAFVSKYIITCNPYTFLQIYFVLLLYKKFAL